MTDADLFHRLARAHDDLLMWRNLVALMPWTVHVDHEARRAHERAVRLLARIPTQRVPIQLPRRIAR